MSLARLTARFTLRATTSAILSACFATLTATAVAQTAQPDEPANLCPALRHIVASADFRPLRDEPDARLPGVDLADDCRTSHHTFDCHWRAHWQADGYVNDPLEELGADIAACLPNVVHDVNTPTRQHFIVEAADRRVSVTASVAGSDGLRLRITQ